MTKPQLRPREPIYAVGNETTFEKTLPIDQLYERYAAGLSIDQGVSATEDRVLTRGSLATRRGDILSYLKTVETKMEGRERRVSDGAIALYENVYDRWQSLILEVSKNNPDIFLEVGKILIDLHRTTLGSGNDRREGPLTLPNVTMEQNPDLSERINTLLQDTRNAIEAIRSSGEDRGLTIADSNRALSELHMLHPYSARRTKGGNVETIHLAIL